MRHLIKYVLVTAVLVAGFHTASRFKTSSSRQSTEELAESEATDLSSHPEASETDPPITWQAPAAALGDPERAIPTPIDEFRTNRFVRPTLKRQPTIKESSSVGALSMAEELIQTETSEEKKRQSYEGFAANERWKTLKEPAESKEESTAGREPSKTQVKKGSKTGKRPRRPDARQVADKAKGGAKKPYVTEPSDEETKPSSDDDPSGPSDWRNSKPNSFAVARRTSVAETTPVDPWHRNKQERQIEAYKNNSYWDSLFESDATGVEEKASPDVADKASSPSRASDPWRQSARLTKTQSAVREKPKSERHRIVAGDTLPKLAATHLGDRDRYQEIFSANPDVLSDPRLLPIGAEIVIPTAAKAKHFDAGETHAAKGRTPVRRRESERTESDDDPEGDMVPIPTFALPARISG